MTNITNTAEWINSHKETYRNTWVAVKDGVLIDFDKSREKLQEKIKEQKNILIIYL